MTQMESDEALAAGDRAPDFDLRGVDGETHTLGSFADKTAVLLVFTCNHCPYAKAKFDTLNDIATDYDDVAVVGVNPNDATEYPDDSFERMQALVEDDTIRYDAYLRDDTQETARAYGATCTPDPFVLRNADGGFELAYHGRLDDALNPDDEPTRDGGDARDAIDSVLAGESVETAFQPSRGCSIKWTDDGDE